MDLEAAIVELERLYPTATRGQTASPSGTSYESAAGLQFHLCRCSHGDPTYGAWEFVAVGPMHGLHHVGIDPVQSQITYGPNGYHQSRRPVCAP